VHTIFKYPFDIAGEFSLDLPTGAVLLHVADQGGIACLWAMVHTERETERRYFRVFGTGHPIEGEEQLTFVGTFQQSSPINALPSFVWHVFEVVS
jgi:hypothetical protein